MDERPNWSAIGSMINDLRHTLDNVGQTQRQVLAVTGTAWSEDRLVKAVVGPRGQLLELEIDPRIYRTPNSTALAASILSTVRAAVDDANTKTKEIIERALPRDRGLGLGPTDVDRMLERHDSDLPALYTKEDGHGHLHQD